MRQGAEQRGARRLGSLAAPRRAAWRLGALRKLVKGLLSLLAAVFAPICTCAAAPGPVFAAADEASSTAMFALRGQRAGLPRLGGIARHGPARQAGGPDRLAGELASFCKHSTYCQLSPGSLQATIQAARRSCSRSQPRCALP